MHQDRYYFQGVFNKEAGVLANAFCSNRFFSEQSKYFKKSIQQAEALETRAEKIKAFRVLLESTKLLEAANSNELMSLYSNFREIGCFNDMISLYNSVDNTDFKKARIVREMLAFAYNKRKKPDEAIKVIQGLCQEGKESGEIYRILGRSALLQSDQATDPNAKKQFLQQSAELYEKGFRQFFEFYPGIQAVHRNIELGNIEKARKMADLVLLACKRDGSKETNDFRCMSARLEASCILEKQSGIDKTLHQIMTADLPVWQLCDTIQTLKRVNKHFKSEKTAKVIDSLECVLFKNPINLPEKENHQQEQVLNAIHKNSYTYRGAGSSFHGAMTVEGNFAYGGQLPTHTISRKDLEFFDHLLDQKMENLFPETQVPKGLLSTVSFNEIKNPEMFIQMTDQFIRYHFGTNNFIGSGLNLEDNASIQNSTYDRCVDALIKLSGKDRKKEDDSKTNISAIFALGLGDCRHHAQVKQIMFDCWQKKKLNNALASATNALDRSDDKAYDDAVNHFYSIYNVELRTIDVQVKAPIKMQKPYMPATNAQGKLVYDPKANLEMEEHTMSILLRRDKDGLVQQVGLRDAFYQNNYKWGKMDIPVDQIKVSGTDFFIPAGFIAPDKMDTGKSVPITISPTTYAGKRDVVSKDCTGEQIRLLGIPVKELSTEYDFTQMLQKRHTMNKELSSMQIYSANYEAMKDPLKSKEPLKIDVRLKKGIFR